MYLCCSFTLISLAPLPEKRDCLNCPQILAAIPPRGPLARLLDPKTPPRTIPNRGELSVGQSCSCIAVPRVSATYKFYDRQRTCSCPHFFRSRKETNEHERQRIAREQKEDSKGRRLELLPSSRHNGTCHHINNDYKHNKRWMATQSPSITK